MSIRPSALPRAPAAQAKGKVGRWFVAQVALLAAALTLYVLVLIQGVDRHQDFNAYLQAGRDLVQGHPLYATFLHHPFPDPTLRPAFIYPPAFAILIAPLAMLPVWLGAALWLIACQAALLASLAIVIRAERPSWSATVGILCLTLTFYPLWVDIIQGQANLLILLLVTGGIVGMVRARPGWAAAIGIAAALKLTPSLLLGWLLVERRFREVAWLMGGFTLVTAIGALIRPEDTAAFFTQVLPALAKGTAFYANYSVSGFLARVFQVNPYTNPWLPLPFESLLPAGAALGLFGFWLWRGRRSTPLHHALTFLPLLPLLSAVTWSHHLVLLLPVLWLAIIGIARRGWPAGETAALAAITVTLSLVARWSSGPAFGQPGFRAAQTMDPAVLIVANSLLLGTLGLFLLAPWLLRSR